MKVRARHNINLSGTRISGGQVFEISVEAAERIADMVEVMEAPAPAETEAKTEEAPKRRGRPKKAEQQ